MILIGLGANLPSAYGPPRVTLTRALDRMPAYGLYVRMCSRWFRSAPVPASDQPWFINAVAVVAARHPPGAVLTALHAIEAELGRARSDAVRFPPRAADLDLLAHGSVVSRGDAWPVLPHPRMHERAFVLAPLADVAPSWNHPVQGATAAALLATIGADQVCEPADPADGGDAG